MDRNYDVIIFISKHFYFKRPRVALIADIVKLFTMFIETIFKDSKKVKRIRKLCNKMQSISAFIEIAKFTNFQ